MIFGKLRERDPAAAETIGDLPAEHWSCAKRLWRVAQAVESVLSDLEVPRHAVQDIILDFIEHERRHIAMEERDFFPAAVEALERQEWAEIASRLTNRENRLFSETVEERFDAVRRHILEMEEEAEAERPAISGATLAAARAFCRSASPSSS